MAIRSTLWQSPDTSSWVKPYAAGSFTPSNSPFPGNPEAFAYDPERVSGDVAKYYGAVTSALPTFAPIMRNVRGLPNAETARMLGQAGAERGVGIGSYGAGNDLTAYLRALGLTGQELMDKGIEQYQGLLGTVPRLDPQSLFISPTSDQEMRLKWATNQADINAALQRQVLANQASLEQARIGQATAFGTQRERIAAENAWAQQNRADQLAYDERNQGYNPYAVDPWYGSGGPALEPITAPASAAPTGYTSNFTDTAYGYLGLPRTGGVYMDDALPGAGAEWAVLAGLKKASDYLPTTEFIEDLKY